MLYIEHSECYTWSVSWKYSGSIVEVKWMLYVEYTVSVTLTHYYTWSVSEFSLSVEPAAGCCCVLRTLGIDEK